ncbi:hypothetical protein GOP47_0014557 [Adiantum capillus-veneris]|uniref:Uncharacterized protein n=1 Tax=Adiantum capillus-veneris TaxID=13818 RepID=A0A9D4UM94_ADICA|nr:hypothetical protein GOP47_0014557 [Adiantum capillus-veneris]
MFCLEEEFSHRARDFLAAAFVFEGKEYCVVQLPYNCPAPEFLQYFTFIPRTDWTGETPEDQDVLLYVLHQKSLANGFEVRLAASQDMGSIRDLLRGSETFTNISHWVEQPTKGCMALVASCGAEVIGVAFVDTNCPANALISHFDLRQLMNIDQHQETCQAVLTLFCLNPLFANRQRLFLREIMRQMTKTILFLPVFQGQNVSNMLEDMVLVPGRWHSSMSPPCTWTQVSPNSRSSFRGSVQQYTANTVTGQYVGFDCALFMMTHRLLSRKRTLVNSRIVVVGASQVAAAYLNKMITCTNVKFSNLTLISPFGLKSLCDGSKTLLDAELGPANAFQKMGIDCLVKVVTDTVVDFDKRAKCVQLTTGKKLQYDYLILTVGLQDQTRAKIQADSNKGVVNLDELSIMINENALNVFKLDLPVVIYGLSLQTFCSIHLLLSKGVPGSSMVVVYPEFEPLDSFAEHFFQDGFIAASLMKEIRAAGVIERSGFKLLEVIPGGKEGLLQAVGLEKIFRASFSSLNQINDGGICIKQPCKLLVACTQPHVDQTLFRAIRKEGLVFNGRIVVDGNFQTNDPSIFACGSSAMFSRQCGKHLIHELFNSYELGQSLAKSIVSLFTDYLPSHGKLWDGLLLDPFETLPPARPIQMWPKTSIPRLMLAKGVSALLPGNFVYFKVKNGTLQTSCNQDKPMQPLIVKKDEWILKVEWTDTKELGAITYWGKVNLEAWKFIRLAGCYDPLISNLSLGNSKAMMNISSFFAQPWFTLIFHDKFLDFYSELSLDVYQMVSNAPESQNVVQDVVRDAYIMFLSVYKADFPGLNFSSSWFLSKSDQHPRRGMLGVLKSTGRSHSNAKPSKQDDVIKDNEVVEVVSTVASMDSSCKASILKDEVKASSQMNNDVAERSEERKLSVQEELVLAVESIVEQIVRAQLKISSSVEAGGSKKLSLKEEIELVVENIVKNLVNSEAMNVSAEAILEGARSESSIEVEVELVVRQIVEKLAGWQAVDKNGSPIVRVRLTFVKNAEGGVLVEKTQVELLVEDEISSSSIGMSYCLDASKVLEEDQHTVNVRLLVASPAKDDGKLVRVHFEHPQNDHVIGTRFSSAATEENTVKLILNLGSVTGVDKLVKVHFEYPQNAPVILARLSSPAENIVKLILDCGREGSVRAKLIPNE